MERISMPRDKTLSHLKVNKAIKEEFLEKGYEAASIRSIGARAGMTSAGLYRHYKDKEAMFSAMVEPLLEEIKDWTRRHIDKKNKMMDDNDQLDQMIGENFVDMIREVILPRKDEFKLLLTASAGTKYENYLHKFVEDNQEEFSSAILRLKEMGYPAIVLDEEEMHILLSAYLTACFEPIIHDYDEDKIEKYLNTLQEFFMPGWMRIMGVR